MFPVSVTPMAEVASPSVHAHELWQIPNPEALALVDSLLGPPEDWSASALLAYRLSAGFQADWKAEVGHWLHAAVSHAFAGKLLRPVFGERDRKRRNEIKDLHDQRHLKLHQHLAVAMVCHYFTGIGWSFGGFDTETGGTIDIDLELRAPDDTRVEWQVKAPDLPMQLKDGRYVDGDDGDRVVEALEHAARQLPQPARSVSMLGVFAQRTISLTSEPSCVVSHVFGSTVQIADDPNVYLPRERFGRFMQETWNHVAGIVLLDINRDSDLRWNDHGVEIINNLTYPCTVLLNPHADRPANPDWFPRARVVVLEGNTFRWIRGEPSLPHGLPTGTRIVDELPRRRP